MIDDLSPEIMQVKLRFMYTGKDVAYVGDTAPEAKYAFGCWDDVQRRTH